MEKSTTLNDLKVAQQELISHHRELEKCTDELKTAHKNLDIGEFEMEKRILEANDDIENMMFTISHKLRKSIAKILGIANLLCDDAHLEGSELREMLGIIIQSAESLNKSTEELSVFIRSKKS